MRNELSRKKPLTKSYNLSHQSSLSEKENAILKAVKTNDFPITPKEIASMTGINHNTVRQYCRKLEKQALVTRTFRGHYTTPENVATFASSIVGGGVPRVHGLRLRFSGVGVGGSKWVRKLNGVVKITFMVHKNGSATVFIDCIGDSSLDAVGFRIVLALIQEELSVTDTELAASKVASYELNTDFQGLRLDGVKAITLKAFGDAFWRVYNKRGFLRSEVKATKPLDVANVLALMNAGVSQYNVLQLLFLNFQEMKRYVEAAKFQNRHLVEITGRNRRLADALLRKREPDV